MKKTTEKVQICSKVKIDIDQVGVVRLNDAQI